MKKEQLFIVLSYMTAVPWCHFNKIQWTWWINNSVNQVNTLILGGFGRTFFIKLFQQTCHNNPTIHKNLLTVSFIYLREVAVIAISIWFYLYLHILGQIMLPGLRCFQPPLTSSGISCVQPAAWLWKSQKLFKKCSKHSKGKLVSKI